MRGAYFPQPACVWSLPLWGEPHAFSSTGTNRSSTSSLVGLATKLTPPSAGKTWFLSENTSLYLTCGTLGGSMSWIHHGESHHNALRSNLSDAVTGSNGHCPLEGVILIAKLRLRLIYYGNRHLRLLQVNKMSFLFGQ